MPETKENFIIFNSSKKKVSSIWNVNDWELRWITAVLGRLIKEEYSMKVICVVYGSNKFVIKFYCSAIDKHFHLFSYYGKTIDKIMWCHNEQASIHSSKFQFTKWFS